MSKYNRIVSIPIEQIPNDEIKQAIKEWSEGNNELEKLLTTLYEKNIKTTGCHVGPNSYLALFVDDHQKEIENMLSILKKKNNWNIFISPDGGNPFSGPDFYKAYISIGFCTKKEEELSHILKELNDTFYSISEIDRNNLFSHVIELHDLFKEKHTDVNIRIENKQDIYIFRVEGIKYLKTMLDSNIVELLNKLKMKRFKSIPIERESWFYATNDFAKFENKVLEIKNILKNELIINEVTEINDKMPFNLKAFINKKNMTEKEFNHWLDAEWNKRFEKPKSKSVIIKRKIQHFKRSILKKIGLYDREKERILIKRNREIEDYIKKNN